MLELLPWVHLFSAVGALSAHGWLPANALCLAGMTQRACRRGRGMEVQPAAAHGKITLYCY